MKLLIKVIKRYQLLTEEELNKAIHAAKFHNEQLIFYLIKHKLISATLIAKSCSRFYYLPYEELYNYSIEDIRPLQPTHKNFSAIVLMKKDHMLKVAIAYPEQLGLLEDYQWQMNQNLSIVFVDLDKFIEYEKKLKLQGDIFSKLDSTIKNQLQKILEEAIHKKASDIHFEPHKFQYRIRLRIDGSLYELQHLDITKANAMTNCLKVMANLDIAENRLPQDGHFNFCDRQLKTHSCRLSICNTIFGEKCVVRILNTHDALLKFSRLGLSAAQQKLLIQALKKSQGLILVTGPTGSGKTITLYSALKYLNTLDKNIYSIEDPVEIEMLGIHQVNINTKIGLTFTQALRAFLRQDPDIIMIGEIRDVETAQTVIRAAQTGHLVLSTLHTNSALETIKCLKKMQVHSFDLSQTVQLIIAQRLVKKLCDHCKKYTIKYNYIPQSCEKCIEGYHGRTGIYELMPFSSKMHETISSDVNQQTLKALAIEEGMQFLCDSAMEKVKEGITSFSEIQRVL